MKRYIGVQELASGFIRRGFSFMFPCVDFVHPLCFGVSPVPAYLDQAPVINIVCLCAPYLHLKDTSPAPSRPSHARTSPVRLGGFSIRGDILCSIATEARTILKCKPMRRKFEAHRVKRPRTIVQLIH